MDPVSAVGVASAILTFVDVGTKLTRGTLEIYKSATGSTENNAQLKVLVQDLYNVTADLQLDIKSGSKHEKALLELAAECRKLSERLLGLLRELTISGERTLHKSLKIKFKSMRKDREIQEINAKLADYRSQLFLHLNLVLREEQSAINVRLESVQSTCQELQSQNSEQLGDLRQQIIQSIAQLQQQNEAKHPDKTSHSTKNLVDGLQNMLKTLCHGLSKFPMENAILKSLYYPSMYDRQSSIGAEEEGTFRWILEDERDEASLSDYSTDDETEEGENADADQGTSPGARIQNQDGDADSVVDFESNEESHEEKDGASSVNSGSQSSARQEHDEFAWIGDLEQEKYKARVRSAFENWLKAGDGIFHISGKAGSGKSTLMSFLCEHERTKDLLLEWAGGEKLVFAKFFFWNPGDKMQSSLQGLYRSILFEVLKNCTELIPRLFPREWKMLQRKDILVEDALLSDVAIKQAFEILSSRERVSGYRFCFFIDGLDEHEGDSKDHVQLAENLLCWSSHTDVKICASSRPHNEFIHVFSDSIERRMHLHELTERDIHLFTRRSIESDRNFHCIRNDYLRLVNEIVRMSDGVFLWARLVVRSLSAGMLRSDTISALEDKLHHIPRDIDHLYQSLFEAMDKQDRKRAMKMLHLAAHNPSHEPMNAVVFAWIDDLDDPHFPPTDGIRPSSWMRPCDMVAKVQRQLAGITKGLLYVSYNHTHRESVAKEVAGDFDYKTRPLVQFLHRSVRDYILTAVLDENLSMQYKEVALLESYVRLWIAEMTLSPKSYRIDQWQCTLWIDIEVLFREELLLHLLDAVRLLTISNDVNSYDDALCNHQTAIFSGLVVGAVTFSFRTEELSFPHLAAYCSQKNYVARELKLYPTLFAEEKNGLNLLLSAALGCGKDMVQFLLINGFSAKADVLVTVPRGEDPDMQISCPIWMIYVTWVVRDGLRFGVREGRWEVVQLLLLKSEKDARNVDFVFLPSKEGDESELEIIDLMQMIQTLNPHNKDSLLRQLDERSLGRLGIAWRSLLSNLQAEQPNQNTEKYTAHVEEFHKEKSDYKRGDYLEWNGKGLVCISLGDLILPGNFRVRLY